jgi:PhnB protein
MKKADPYLNFNGSTEKAFNFYKAVFGGEFTSIQRLKDVPESGNIPEHAKNMIMHIALPLGTGTVLMGTDAPESMGFKVVNGNNVHILLNAESEAEAAKLFGALSKDGKVTMELQKTFWGAFYGSCTDKFGINWMINFDYNQP